MAQSPNFDPYSKDALESVQLIEDLPTMRSFENLMYEHRFERKALYQYGIPSLDEPHPLDASPIHIPNNLLVTQFPEGLRDLFPEVEYAISELRVIQEETKGEDGQPQTFLSLSFLANDKPHLVSGSGSSITYETVNEALEPVHYSAARSDVVGLIATLVYARQYDPEDPLRSLELHEASIVGPRELQVSLIEQMIMTLGHYSGFSSIHTRALFDNPSGNILDASLIESETPLKTVLNNQLTLDEISTKADLLTSTATALYNLDATKGLDATKYAKQETTVLTSIPITASVEIIPGKQYEQWAHLCAMFANIVRGPLKAYDYLDDDIDDDDATEEPL